MKKLYETITAENWCKGHGTDSRGRHCVVGHLRALRGKNNEIYNIMPQLRLLNEVSATLFPDRSNGLICFNDHPDTNGLICFNDHPDTTVEDVIRVCKVADV